MKKIIPFLLFFPILFACKNDSQQKGGEADAAIIEQTNVMLLCKTITEMDEETGAPMSEVYLQLAESKVKVADINTCETITPDLYEQYQIPKGAISAAGGWFAGAGDYLYLIEEDGNYVVKKGEIFEESEDNNYNYRVIAKYSKTGKLVN